MIILESNQTPAEPQVRIHLEVPVDDAGGMEEGVRVCLPLRVTEYLPNARYAGSWIHLGMMGVILKGPGKKRYRTPPSLCTAYF